MTKIFIIAGEPSGDVLGARLMAVVGGCVFEGVGGVRMAEAGLVSRFPMSELSVMGLAEILPRVLALRRRLSETVAAILASRPDVVVTIDSPGFCLRVLRGLEGAGIRRVHYVAPQVWAWRQQRVRKFPGLWEELLCLLPFEPAFFEPFGLNPVFVGHPVLESGADRGDAARFRARHGVLAEEVPVVLMPGSRVTETVRLLPIFSETMRLLAAAVPGLRPVVCAAAGMAAAVASHTAGWGTRAPIIVTDVADRYDAFAAAGAALTKSGTSTLELAMAGVPMAVTYRVNPLSAAIGRRLIKVSHVAMINLLAGSTLVPELLQQDCTPARLSAALHILLTSPAAAAAQRRGFAPALASLAAPAGLPSHAAALRVLAGRHADDAAPDFTFHS
jgi:lipid-A-disaccharide synthase